MANILPENETTTFEEKVYVNPQTSLDEQLSFIDNYRTAQATRNQQITNETHNLGTDIPSNLGGLTGGEGYWTSRYQVPQTNTMLNDLRATAQAQALNDMLANEQAMWKNRYQKAYRDYQKRAAAKGNGGATPSTEVQGNVTPQSNVEAEGEVWQEVFAPSTKELAKNGPGTYSTTWNGQYNITTDQNGNVVAVTDANGKDAMAAWNRQKQASGARGTAAVGSVALPSWNSYGVGQ